MNFVDWISWYFLPSGLSERNDCAHRKHFIVQLHLKSFLHTNPKHACFSFKPKLWQLCPPCCPCMPISCHVRFHQLPAVSADGWDCWQPRFPLQDLVPAPALSHCSATVWCNSGQVISWNTLKTGLIFRCLSSFPQPMVHCTSTWEAEPDLWR